MRKIVKVEAVDPKEFKVTENPIGMVMQTFKECSQFQASNNGTSYKFIYTNQNCEVVEHEFSKIIVGKNAFFGDSFNDRWALLAVKIWYDDGSSEYGFKWYEIKDIVNGQELKHLYLKDGTFTGEIPEFGDIVECYDVDASSRIAAWILELLPLWNERVRQWIESMSEEKFLAEYTNGEMFLGHTLGEWITVQSIVNSSYINRDCDFTLVEKPDGTKIGVNWAMTDMKEVNWHPYLTTWDDNVCVNESGALKDGMEVTYKPVISAYSYLKSIYEDKKNRRKVYHIIPLSDLLSIRKSGHKDEEDIELWNNLDSTINGDIDRKVA